MILIIDNYDSFVYNLSCAIGKLGKKKKVMRNDKLSIVDIKKMQPEAIVLSPGPKAPKDAGMCLEIIQHFYKDIPILGICLGHQCIGEVFGGKTCKAPYPMHGKTSLITHNNLGLFTNAPNPLKVARYHSLIVELSENSILLQTAHVDGESTLMGLAHPKYPLYGLQFHPESILTENGNLLIENFLTIAESWNKR